MAKYALYTLSLIGLPSSPLNGTRLISVRTSVKPACSSQPGRWRAASSRAPPLRTILPTSVSIFFAAGPTSKSRRSRSLRQWSSHKLTHPPGTRIRYISENASCQAAAERPWSSSFWFTSVKVEVQVSGSRVMEHVRN
ncbi:hypothetical protein FIBSPDRAFT_306728, partial [Athelia psychrophila]